MPRPAAWVLLLCLESLRISGAKTTGLVDWVMEEADKTRGETKEKEREESAREASATAEQKMLCKSFL